MASNRIFPVEHAAALRVRQLCAETADATDLHEALPRALDGAIALTGADMGNIQLVDPPTGTLAIAAQRGFARPFLEFFAVIMAETDFACGVAFATRQRVLISDVASSPVFVGTPARQVMLDAGARAVHSTPIVGASGRVLGVISTHWRRHHPQADYDAQLIAAIADAIAARVEQAAARTRRA
jgi:GAF domain-containing protein